jgi:signal transduction histidine kinase/HAMP domain-containing protein
MGKINKLGHSASNPMKPSVLNIPGQILNTTHELIRYLMVVRDFGKRAIACLRSGGIRRRLMVWGLSLFGFALTVVVVVGYSYTVSQIKKDAAQLQIEIASVTAERIRDFVQRKLNRFSDTADAVSLYPLGSKEQQLLVSLLVKNDASFTHASIIDAQGIEVLKVSDRKVYFPSDLSDQSQSAKFNKAIKGDDYISPVYTSERFQPYVSLAIPLWGGAQSVAGVMAAEADLSFLWEVIGKIQFGTAGYAYLVDAHGNLIAHKDSALVLKGMDLRHIDGVRNFLRNPTRSDPTPAREGPGLMDRPVLATYAPVPELGWGVILEEPLDAALANIEILKRYAAVLLVVSLAIGAVIIAWVSSKMTGPILELRQGAATIGAGNLEHRTNIQTGDEIQELADEFNKMTDALQNSYATLEQKVAQRTKEISALYGVTTAVNQSLALEDILNAVIAKTTEIFHFESTRVLLFNDEMDELQVRASFEVDSEHLTGVRALKRGQGVVGQVAESGEPMMFEDVRTDPRYAALSATKATLNAKLGFFAVFPIKTQVRIFGVILFSARSPRQLTADEIRLLTSMSEHLAVAVEKANLFRQSEARSRQLFVLNTIGAAVSRSLNLEMVLNEAIEKMTEKLNFDASWIYILDPSGKELSLKAYKGLGEDIVQSIAKRNLSAGVTAKIFETGERLVFEDFQNDPTYKHLSVRHKIASLGFASAAGFPIKANDEVIGVLHLANKAPRHFAHDELQLIESIAQEIGVAAANARLFEQVNQKTAELGRMNQELQEANQAKDEFLSVMSHELRTPLNVITGYAEVLSQGVLGDIQREQLHAVKTISYQSKELLRMINEILQVGSIEAGKVKANWQTVNIVDFLVELRSSYEILAKKDISLHWDIPPRLPVVRTDGEKLKHVLQNLINNAIKFTENGSVTVSARCISKAIEFEVKDTGIGMPGDMLPSIFQMFRQLDSSNTRSYGGSGVGLYIVKKFIDLLGGKIEVDSALGEGSTFIVTLPQDVSATPHINPGEHLAVKVAV